MSTSLVVIEQGTTPGQARSDSWLARALSASREFTVTTLPFGAPHPKWPFGRQVFVDLMEAASARRSLLRSGLTQASEVVFVLPSTTLGLFMPRSVLRRSIIRFDALACENRPGWTCLPLRMLERRSIRAAGCLAPYSLLPSTGKPRDRLMRNRVVVQLPTPAEHLPVTAGRHPLQVLAYCANRHKKGLDIVLRAWSAADRPAGCRLTLVGVDVQTVHACAEDVGADLATVDVRGRVAHAELLRLMSMSSVFLAGARYEDFGIAPLEAMASGLVIVTARSSGPFEAGRLLTSITPQFMAANEAPRELAACLSKALRLSEEEAAPFRAAAAAAAAAYAPDAVDLRLRGHLAPQIRRLAKIAR